jgi:hypothetical protein
MGSALHPAMFYERAFLQFDHRLLQLARVVHDDGSIPGDRLFERLTGDEQIANPFRSGLDDDFVPAIKQH